MVAHPNILVPKHRLILPGDPDFEWPCPERVWEGRLSPAWLERPLWRAMFGDWPLPTASVVQLFGPTGTAGSTYVPYRVPEAGLLALWAVNSASGGGGGRTDVAGTQRQGGGGGASAPWGKCVIPVQLLPRVIYPRAGVGGAGGAASTNGANGNFSDWCAYPSASTNAASQDTILFGGALSTGGAGGATAAAGSTGGGGGSTGVGGLWSVHAIGTAGGAGVTGTAGGGGNGSAAGPALLFATSHLHPGLGGGGVTSADAGVAGGAYGQSTAYGWAAPGGTVPGGNGANGIMTYPWSAHGTDPWYGLGGTGGGGHPAGTGGSGGQGAWGCGGGGGGAGTTGGRGGNGGDGFCLAIRL